VRAPQEVLQDLSFGQRVAEQELDRLAAYFVETSQWRRIVAGEVDIVYGQKGAGKSAIYLLLLQHAAILSNNRVIVRAAERPQGLPAFAEILADPPETEGEWRALWRAYFVCLAAEVLSDERIETEEARRVQSELERLNLITGSGLEGVLRSARQFASRFKRVESIEGGVTTDPLTGALGATAKLSLREATQAGALEAATRVNATTRDANRALDAAGLSVWLALDRLDVAFEDSSVEREALRALMRVYLDFQGHPRIRLKIFLRTDIWSRVTDSGFREASHVVRTETISWSRDSMLDLIMRRLLENAAVAQFYEVEPSAVLETMASRESLFYRIFPKEVSGGSTPLPSLEWIVSRTRDAHGNTAPREVIHFMTALRDAQLKRHELGQPPPSDGRLFGSAAFRDALAEVSRTRVHQTLYAESPKLKEFVRALEGAPSAVFSFEQLAEAWRTPEDEAREITDALIGVAFLAPQANDLYVVPYLYRPALNIGGHNGG
jgi:hypothetical protein